MKLPLISTVHTKPIARKSRIITKAVIAGVGAVLLAVGVPLSASAHVTVAPNTATEGSYTVITVKVPNESATAQTNKVELSLPTDTPFTSVSYVPVPGWTTELVRTTLAKPATSHGNTITEAVTTVIWTSTSTESNIHAGQLQMFPLSVGPVPNATKIVMPALQTYTDGTIVKWVETAKDAQHPAPVLQVVNGTAPIGSGTTSEASTDTVARGLGIGGLVVAAIGVAVAIAAIRRKVS